MNITDHWILYGPYERPKDDYEQDNSDELLADDEQTDKLREDEMENEK